MEKFVFLIALLILGSSARTIKWTGQGGTPLWDFNRNWDCNCVPTIQDDVQIDVPFTPATVRIGGTSSYARSLTVGGSSPFGMQLIIQGQLTLGVGGGRIASNGLITLDAAPNLPFTTSGPFNADRGLVFNSGSLSGPGSFQFSYVNLTGPALKVFNSTVVVTGSIEVQPGPGNVGVVDVQGGTLSIYPYAIFYTNSPLTFSVYPKASFNMTGTFVYEGGSSQNTLTFRGYSQIKNLTINSGSVVINDAIFLNSTYLASGTTLTLIGAGTTSRNVSFVSGSGTVVVQGGVNTFNNLNGVSLQLQSGVLQTSSRLTPVSFTATGGTVQGSTSASLVVQTATIANLQLVNVGLNATSLNINGFTSITSSKVNLVSKGVVTAASQFTMSGGAQFTVQQGATLSQSYDFKILPSGTDQPSLLTNNGQWTSTSSLSCVVNTQGNGAWNLGQGATLTITGIAFNANSVTLDGAAFVSKVSVVNVNEVDGSSDGTIDFEGQQFYASTLDVDTYLHNGGSTVFDSGTLGTLTLTSGNVNVTSATLDVLDFRGGNLNGATKGAKITVSNTTFTTTNPKNLNGIDITSTSISLNCPSGQCQIFQQNASVHTP